MAGSARRGKLFVLEGPDGVGKTTLARALVKTLGGSTGRYLYLAFPGGGRGSIGELVYRIHHARRESGLERLTASALQILHVAAHADEIEHSIRPALAAGKTVLLDRFWWSAWVYGRRSGVGLNVMKSLVELEKSCWGKLRPSAIVLVDRPILRESAEDETEQDALRSSYRRLARRESQDSPVVRFVNRLPVPESVGALADALGLRIPTAPRRRTT